MSLDWMAQIMTVKPVHHVTLSKPVLVANNEVMLFFIYILDIFITS